MTHYSNFDSILMGAILAWNNYTANKTPLNKGKYEGQLKRVFRLLKLYPHKKTETTRILRKYGCDIGDVR